MSKDEIIATQRAEIAQLKFRLMQLERLIFSRKSEKWMPAHDNPEQLQLFDTLVTDPVPEVSKESISYERKKPNAHHPGRNVLPDHLPVEEVIIEPDVDVTGMVKIGEEVTETLDYQPASLRKIRTIRPKYAHPSGSGVVIGKLPSRPIDKCIAEAGLLSHIIVSKFVDHLPFYRQVQQFERDYGWKVNESTVNDWFVSVCTLMKPLYEALVKSIMTSGYLQVDESPIRVLDKDKQGGTHMGYQWVFHAPYRKEVFFQYRKGRGAHGPKETLSSYSGFVQCDGWSAYEKMAIRNQNMTLIGCLAHVRRKYYEAEKIDPRAGEVLKLIGRIYTIDRELSANQVKDENGKLTRSEMIRPIFDE